MDPAGPIPAEFMLPKPNAFIPTDFELKGHLSRRPSSASIEQRVRVESVQLSPNRSAGTERRLLRDGHY